MKNYNYNLLKLLHSYLDNVWRIEKHYLHDAQDLPCDCKKILEEIKADGEKNISILRKEIEKHNLSE
jgi:hypothetical protein